ncbi:MAG: AcrR family transcriptional regulator [Limisphaerales bacterium]|jgi:AcrR family transcriptional regulator
MAKSTGNTKFKIISAARKYFNHSGFSPVSLFELAQHMEMSRGNLTYHFKDKEVLLEAIAEELWSKIEAERSKTRQLPSFENLHNEIQLYQRVQKDYAFIFHDSHVLNHPVIKKKFREMTEQTILDNTNIIAFSIRIGNMNPERIAGTYRNIALLAWMVPFYWMPQQKLRGKQESEDAEKIIWSLLLPHFTEQGIKSFKAFFGESYFEDLGPAFDLTKLLSF